MEKLVQSFEKVFIHENSQDSLVAKRFKSLFAKERIEIVNETPFKNAEGTLSAEDFDRSKKNIFIKKFEGQFFKQCPGSKPGLVCCNYFVLNLGLQCNMNCSYCYLQSYINTPVMTVYSNIEESLNQLDQIASQHPEKPYRVGTGETIDSLSLDPLTLYSHQLIDFFKRYPKWTLELKTKSNFVDHFIDLPHAGNVQVAWSINPSHIIEQEEHSTASFEERITAAKKCLSKGFKVAFHIDPIIWHPNWKENYLGLVSRITEEFRPEDIPHISLGTLRFQPEQRHIMKERFGMQSLVTSAEMFRSKDGKMRYDYSLRKEMFQTLLEAFKQHSPRWRVALCMETPEAWVPTIQGSPRKNQNLEELFRPLPKVPKSKQSLQESSKL